ncbi:hypothetical protein I8751_22470 [Nostocaceae cyanobacterium CENA357]|uniref:Uncharacterized protein n=1 Tax=Atlanticothrix silvestris CENA357 TaxID=1725252 RepID=A0A8J7HHC0_9CYAN|nr:hypothetical protein [Atlanticothrix silvestris]MBH8555061.1 hypothetical protein [Atlanticothrix silvestris CENA357]
MFRYTVSTLFNEMINDRLFASYILQGIHYYEPKVLVMRSLFTYTYF